MSRLKKVAMDMNAIKNVLDQSSSKGRKILKELEDFKFTLEQTARLLNNNQAVTQGLIKKRTAIDEISTKLYQIVFDIENLDVSESFNEQNPNAVQDAPQIPPDKLNPNQNQQNPNGTNPNAGPNTNPNGPNIQPPQVPQPPQNPNNSSNNDEEKSNEEKDKSNDEENKQKGDNKNE